jgi:3-oxoacyl-[acyl-carrier protein] reductase
MTEQQKKVWLITGASRGIGLATAERALAAGDRVALLARGEIVEELAAALGPDALPLRADVADPEQVGAAVARVQETWGTVDRIVNNAGYHRGGKIGKLSAEAWQAVLDVNLSGALNVITACNDLLQADAAIVNVGAVVGFRGFPGDVAYAASKSGLAGLTRALAIEYAARGITVNLVIPGLVLTDMTEGLSPKALEAMRRKIPLQRYGEAAEIADVIVWVAGSRYMTGAFIPTDGGLMSSFGIAG